MRRLFLAPSLLALVAATPRNAADAPYLTVPSTPDGLAILPPPPAPGSASQQRDRAIFVATRGLAGSPRWRLAADDVVNAPLGRFACALDLELTAQTAPTMARLLDRIGTGAVVNPVKAHYAVPRPFVGNDAPICEPRTAHLVGNGDYPSGHAANGWLEGLVLAQLVPTRATAILARARSYGESRAVCGAHSLGAVEAGWIAGTATFAALQSSAGFQRDIVMARRELARLGTAAPRPAIDRCRREAAILAERPW